MSGADIIPMGRRKIVERIPLLAEQDRDLLDADTTARLLGKSRQSVYRYLEEGRLAGRKVGGRWHVYRDAVDRWWEAGLVEQSVPEHYSRESRGQRSRTPTVRLKNR